MPYYYFNENTDEKGRHEVHTENCHRGAFLVNRVSIGYYSTCSEAIIAAKSAHPFKSFDGCYYCCNSCHQG